MPNCQIELDVQDNCGNPHQSIRLYFLASQLVRQRRSIFYQLH